MKTRIMLILTAGLLLGATPVTARWQCEHFKATIEQSRSKPELRAMCAQMELLEARIEKLEALEHERRRLDQLEARIERLEDAQE